MDIEVLFFDDTVMKNEKASRAWWLYVSMNE